MPVAAVIGPVAALEERPGRYTWGRLPQSEYDSGSTPAAGVPRKATRKNLRSADDRLPQRLDNGRSMPASTAPNGRTRPVLHLAPDAPAREAAPGQMPRIEAVAAFAERLRAAIRHGVHIAPEVLDVVVATVLADGHLLVEDHPGVGKTQLARTLAGSLAARFSRVQGTVDLLPTDILGATIWRPESSSFVFRPGPVFAHVLLVDELNRATPKTQSGLLEAMQERQVTVDGESHPLPSPFVVIAAQNPSASHDGTFALPPAQLDRFLARISLGYPDPDQEVDLVQGRTSPVAAVGSPQELQDAQDAVRAIHTSPVLARYVVSLLTATREHPLVEVGASPRAGLLLVAAARARAAIDGRDYVVPDDVQAMAPFVLTHRLQVGATVPAAAAAEVVADALAMVPAR
jgi:MoxR-like ATPase